MTVKEVGKLCFEKKFCDVKDFVDANSQLLKQKDSDERTLLHWSISGGSFEVASYILTKLKDNSWLQDTINQPDAGGWTPLIIAVSVRQDDVVDLLLDNSVDVNVQNNTGQVALHYAASKNRVKIANRLLEHGADVDLLDWAHTSPLHRAVSRGHTQISRMLLSARADHTVADGNGNTPLHVACEEGQTNDVEVLLGHGGLQQLRTKNKAEQTPIDLANDDLKRVLMRKLGASEKE